jgi:hypothetical protein
MASTCEIMWLFSLLRDLHKAALLFALCITANLVCYERTKHIEIDYHQLICGKIQMGLYKLYKSSYIDFFYPSLIQDECS